jgi:hypothetical protein
MLISKAKYHDDLSKAYTRGLEQGFELASKLKKTLIQQDKATDSLSDKNQSREFSLLLQQLFDITENKGIDLE